MRERIFLSPPHMTGIERSRLDEAFASNYIAPCGPMVDRFEREFAERVGLMHAVALASGTAALDLLFEAVGVGPGDRVVCPTLTFIASIAPAVRRGAVPVFVDIDSRTWTLDCAALARELATGPVKAVVAVDLYGQCADYDAIQRLCDRYDVPLLVDAAEALGAFYKGRAAGDAGVASVYSFNGNKIITTSGGGMLATRDAALAALVRKRSAQAREDVPWYEHRELGYNYRMSNLLAAVGVGQLAGLSAAVAGKRAIFDGYVQRLGDLLGVSFMPEADYGVANRWLTVIRLEPGRAPSPEEVRLALEAENIESRPIWKPLHLQPVFAAGVPVRCPVAEQIFAEGLCLPSGCGLSLGDLDEICAVIRRLWGRCPA